MKIKNEIIQKITMAFSIVLGMLYIAFVFWNRFIRQRSPFNLDREYSSLQFNIYLFLFIISLITSVYYLKQILIKHNPESWINQTISKILDTRIMLWINKYIIDAPFNTYEWLFRFVLVRPPLEKLSIFLYDYHLHPHVKYLAYFIFLIRFIISIFFITDIFIYHEFNNFYKSLWLLSIPLVIRLIIFMLFHLADKTKTRVEQYIEITYQIEQDTWTVEQNKHYSEKEISDNWLRYYGTLWVWYVYSLACVDAFKAEEYKYKKYANFFFYSIFCIGWGYLCFLAS